MAQPIFAEGNIVQGERNAKFILIFLCSLKKKGNGW